MNTNYVLIGIVIVALVGGGIFFMSRNNSSSDTSSLGYGSKNLTRESAAKMIETLLRTVMPEELVSVEVTGISEPVQGDGGNIRKATFTYKYKEKGEVKELPVALSATFMLYDDGWRLTATSAYGLIVGQ